MPLLGPSAAAPPVCPVTALVAAVPGYMVTAGAASGPVIAWAQVADPQVPGGVRIDPVWIAGGRTWTPDQYRAANGVQRAVTVTAQ
jgi:hypothetical protein